MNKKTMNEDVKEQDAWWRNVEDAIYANIRRRDIRVETVENSAYGRKRTEDSRRQ